MTGAVYEKWPKASATFCGLLNGVLLCECLSAGRCRVYLHRDCPEKSQGSRNLYAGSGTIRKLVKSNRSTPKALDLPRQQAIFNARIGQSQESHQGITIAMQSRVRLRFDHLSGMKL